MLNFSGARGKAAFVGDGLAEDARELPGYFYLFQKMAGVSKAPPAADTLHILLGFIGSAAAMLIIGWLHELSIDQSGLPLLIAPFAASAVLVFGASNAPFAQPRNVIGGHVISAAVGVAVYSVVGDAPMLAAAIAVPLSITLMHITKTLHPPGGATAFITAAGDAGVHAMGWWYVLTPCALGSVIMVLIALVINNIPRGHRYPQFWR